jgi:tetratricopeptide (TPR) repeat protein
LKKKTQKAKQQNGQGSNFLTFVCIPYKQVSLRARLFLFALLPFFHASAMQADLGWQPPVVKTHELILQYRLSEAKTLLATLPSSPEKAYLLNLSDFLQMIYTEDNSFYENYLNNLKERRTWIEELSDGDARKAFYLADMKLQEALFKIKFGDYLSGLYSLMQARNQIDELQNRDDKILPFLKSSGVINILIGLTPEKYEWAIRLIGLQGDIDRGIEQLTSLSSSSSPLANEASIILGYFYAYPLHEPVKASALFSQILEKQPNSTLSRFMLATSLNKAHRGEQALTTLSKIPADQQKTLTPVNYLFGDLYLENMDLGKAREHYTIFIQSYIGDSFKKDAMTKIAASYYLENDTLRASSWSEKASKMERSTTEPDKNADVFLTELKQYPIRLLKARLLTDGGYWEEAQRQVSTVNPLELDGKWLCEYYYRLARLYHLQGKDESAIPHYQQALKLSKRQPWYMGANAALQLGLIMKSAGKDKEAKGYFEQAMDFQNHPYKASIDSSAERELALLTSD